jgi:uncharacterized protein
MRKRYILVLIISVSMFAAVYFFLNKPKSILPKNENYITQIKHDTKIKIASQEISVQVARTPEEKSKGLSRKLTLSENEGMIFLFPSKTYPSFWMKDMNFGIDIIWISDDTVIHIDKSVPPPIPGQKDEELPLYRPPEPVNYVLEVNSGFSQKYGIDIGDKVDLTSLK